MADDTRSQPRDWPGLLKFCLEQTATDDTTHNEPIAELSEERRAWLQKVLDSIGASDPVKTMLQLLRHITEPQTNENPLDSSKSTTTQEEALENLEEICYDLDLANDFIKIGGFSIFSQLFVHQNACLRWRAASLLATLVQNNPTCQKAALDFTLMPTLLQLVGCDVDLQVKIKATYALSCLVRAEIEECYAEFTRLDGISTLQQALQADEPKLRIKILFMIKNLLIEHKDLKALLIESGFVNQIISLLKEPHNDSHSIILCILADFSVDRADYITSINESSDLYTILNDKLSLLDKEQYQEDIESCKQIKENCFSQRNSINVER